MSELIKQRENEKQTAEFAQNVSNKDLISRKAAIDALQKEINKGKPPFDDVIGSIRCGVRLARNIIEDLPPAQPEIIRCMDCKHYYYADNRIPQEQRYTCDLDGDRWSADSFCSFAERREDE